MKFTKKVVPHGGSLAILLPPEICEARKIVEDDLIELELHNVYKNGGKSLEDQNCDP